MPRVECASTERFVIPLLHTMGRLDRPSRRKGAGAASASVTAEPLALAVTPGGRYTPRNGLLCDGSPTYARLAAASAAVNGVPSEQVIPLRSVSVALRP